MAVRVPDSVSPFEQPEASLQRLRSSRAYCTGNPFREIRVAFFSTQEEAADRIGVSRSLWLAWERKDRPVSAEQLGLVVACFSLDRREVRWVLDWWGDARAAELTVAQLNVLTGQLGGDIDPVEILFRLWSA